jgi:hypothetical protein
VEFVADKVALGQVFSEYFGFPCQFSFHRLLHTHHLPSGAGAIVKMVADVPSGLSLTPPQETKNKKLYTPEDRIRKLFFCHYRYVLKSHNRKSKLNHYRIIIIVFLFKSPGVYCQYQYQGLLS